MNKLLFKFIASTLLLLCSQVSSAQEESVETYSEQDMQKAIILCMTAEYVQFHQEYPAEDNVMDTCYARFKQLTQEIPYQAYQNWVLATPYNPYPPTETATILEKYNRIMLGQDSQLPFIN